MQEIQFYRGSDPFVSIKLTTSASQKKEIMGTDEISIPHLDSRYLSFQIGDWCEIFNEKYILHTLPPVIKLGENRWQYTIVLKNESFTLSNALYLFYGSDNTLKEQVFSMTGTASDFVDLVLKNILRIDTGWEKGEVLTTGYKNLSFSVENCYSALSKIAKAFDTEFWVIDKEIILAKVVSDKGRLFKHGRNKGLYSIDRTNVDTGNIATRVWFSGSDKNLPYGYRNFSSRLLMAPEPSNCIVNTIRYTSLMNGFGELFYSFWWEGPLDPGITAVTIMIREIGTNVWMSFTGNPIATQMDPRGVNLGMQLAGVKYEAQIKTEGGTCVNNTTSVFQLQTSSTDPIAVPDADRYLEKNIDKYGVIEAAKIFDDVYPHRTGIVTAIDIVNPYRFVDADIDFDVNDYLTPNPVTVSFKSGQLAGYSFKLQSFNNSTKSFYLLKNSDEKHIDIPSDLLRPAIGDEYVLTDITLPASYVQEAENELRARAELFMDAVSVPQLKYRVDIDPAFSRRKNYLPQLGEMIWIKDSTLNIEKKIRVVSLIRNLVNEWDIEVELSDTISYGTIDRILNSNAANASDINDLQRFVANRDILNNKASLREISDTTGHSQVWINNATGELVRKL